MIRGREPAERLDVDLVGCVTRDGWLVQEACRDLDILRTQGGKNFACVYVVCGDLVGVQPDAHGILAFAVGDDVGNAGQAGEHVFGVERYVVRYIEEVPRLVGRVEKYPDEDIRSCFSYPHAFALNIVRKP